MCFETQASGDRDSILAAGQVIRYDYCESHPFGKVDICQGHSALSSYCLDADQRELDAPS